MITIPMQDGGERNLEKARQIRANGTRLQPQSMTQFNQIPQSGASR